MWELDNINIRNESEVDDHEGRIKKVYDRPIKIIEGERKRPQLPNKNKLTTCLVCIGMNYI